MSAPLTAHPEVDACAGSDNLDDTDE